MTDPDLHGHPGVARAWVRDGIVAGAWAGALGGVPSTLVALLRGEGAREATRAAGALLLPHEERDMRLLPAAALVHGTLSLGWALVLARLLPREHTVTAGAVAGLVIAALDLGLVGQAVPQVRRLPLAPQVADHVAFGAIAAAVISRRGTRAPATPRTCRR